MPSRRILIASESATITTQLKGWLKAKPCDWNIANSAVGVQALVKRYDFLVVIVAGELGAATSALLAAAGSQKHPVVIVHPGSHEQTLIAQQIRDGAQDVFALNSLDEDTLWHALEVVILRWQTVFAHHEASCRERLQTISALTDGLAHRINNPACYILANLNFLDEELVRIGSLAKSIGRLTTEHPDLTSIITSAIALDNGSGLPATIAEAREAIADSIQGTERICGVANELRRLLDAEHAALTGHKVSDRTVPLRSLLGGARARILLVEPFYVDYSIADIMLSHHEVVQIGDINDAVDTLASDRFFDVVLCNGLAAGIDAVAFFIGLTERAESVTTRTILIGDRALRHALGKRVPVLLQPIASDELSAYIDAAASLASGSTVGLISLERTRAIPS